MKASAFLFGTLVSLLLLCAATVFHLLGSGSGAQAYRETMLLLRQLQQLSTQWSMEVAVVKSDPLGSFDSLSAVEPRMRRLKAQLLNSVAQLPGVPRRVVNEVNGFGNALDAQTERIERFKSGITIVRNSTRYLPLAAENVSRLARDASVPSLARRIEAISSDVSLYVDNPTNTSRSRLDLELSALREESVSLPPTLSNALANFLSHARILVEKQGPTDELYQKATSTYVSVLTDRIVSSLEFEHEKQQTLALRHERGVLASLAILAVFWPGLALHQRRFSKFAESDRRTPLSPSDPTSGQPSDTALSPAKPIAGSIADMELRFLARCMGASLSASANRLVTRLDFLAQTQHRMSQSFGELDSPKSRLNGGVSLDEEVRAAGAVATSVRREIALLGRLGNRLALSASATNDSSVRDMVDVNSCIVEALRTVDAGKEATVATQFREISEIWASRAEIQLLFTKVIENAVDAVREQRDADGAISIDTEQRDSSILVRVIDNGIGISAESQRKIFRPFYTSRSGATGMGLSLAHHLASQYEGDIEVNSLPDQGTVVRILLPATPSDGRELFDSVEP